MALGGNDVRERPTKLFEPSWLEQQLQDPGVCILVPSRCDCYITFTNVPSVQNNWCPQKGGWLTVFGSRQLKQHEQPNSCKSTALQILCLLTCKKGVGGATKLLRIIFYHWQQQWFQEAYQCLNSGQHLLMQGPFNLHQSHRIVFFCLPVTLLLCLRPMCLSSLFSHFGITERPWLTYFCLCRVFLSCRKLFCISRQNNFHSSELKVRAPLITR